LKEIGEQVVNVENQIGNRDSEDAKPIVQGLNLCVDNFFLRVFNILRVFDNFSG
jgi:hypothetical protein